MKHIFSLILALAMLLGTFSGSVFAAEPGLPVSGQATSGAAPEDAGEPSPVPAETPPGKGEEGLPPPSAAPQATPAAQATGAPQGEMPSPTPETEPAETSVPSALPAPGASPEPSASPAPSPAPEASGEPAPPEDALGAQQPVLYAMGSNLALQKPVAASGSEGVYLPENAVDGNAATRWASGYMKPLWADQQIDDTYQQTPSWLLVDLQQPAALERISIQFHSRTWPTTYRIQTADAPDAPEDQWETLVTVTRASADLANITDVFTENDLTSATAKRYLRLYFERVNTYAKAATGTSLFELVVEGGSLEAANLALGRPVTVSGSENASFVGENMVDGDLGTKWSTAPMKDAGNYPADGPQTPQWAIIDLGRSGIVTSGMNLRFLEKCWPMEYKIQTSDDPDCAEADWETLFAMSRPGADQVGQTDLIAAADLANTTLKRYVRFYIEKVNNNFWSSMSIAEFEIMGPPSEAAQTARSVLKKIAGLEPVAAQDTQVALPPVPEGFTAEIIGSSVKNVVSQSGRVSPLILGDRQVDLVLKITNNSDPADTAQKSFPVTVAGRIGAGGAFFPAVGQPNAQPSVIPSLQEWYGYEAGEQFTLTAGSRILYHDAAGVGLDSVARSLAADLEQFTGLALPVAEGGQPAAHDIYLESLENDLYFTGEEGYLLAAGSGGLRIYSAARTGCFYGTITAMQILWQAEGHRAIPAGVTRDYPNYEIRGVMLDVGRFPLRMEFLQDYAKILSWYKLNEYHLHLNDNRWSKNIWSGNIQDWYDRDDADGAHRLESKKFPGLKPVNEPDNAYYNNIYGEPYYTQEEYIRLQQYAGELGVDILSELDTPSHAFAYSKYCLENPDNLTEFGQSGVPFGPIHRTQNLAEFALEGMGNEENAVRAKAFITELFKEYIDPASPVFLNSEVGIGVDEYQDRKTPEAFRKYIVYLNDLLKANGKTARMWGALALFPGDTEIPTDIVIDHWTTGEEDPVARMREGYKLVNVAQPYLYLTPGRWHKDFLNSEYLFKEWDPTMFSPTVKVDSGDPNLLGAKVAMWGDEALDGMLEADIAERVVRAAAILGEKTWGGTKQGASYVEYEQTFDRLREGPGTHIAMEVPSRSEVVLEYDFAQTQPDGTVPDLSGNGYDAALTGAQVTEAEGKAFARFNGSTLLETPLRSLKYPYTLSFSIKAGANSAEASLFSGYDGRLQAAGNSGQLSVNRSFYDQALGYTLPQDKTVDITLVGTFQATRLYVDGELVSYLYTERQEGNSSAGGASHAPINGSGQYHTSFILPLEKIGEGFVGQLANIKLYNKALDPAVIAAGQTGEQLAGEVNVALNTLAYAEHFQANEDKDRTRRKSQPAWKAVDGDFRDETSSLAHTTSPYAAWRSSASDQDYLMVDLGRERSVNRVQILWGKGRHAAAYELLASLDGQAWASLAQVSGNASAETEHALQEPVTARYIKVQGVARANGYYEIEEIKVLEQVDKTSLAELYEQLKKALQAPNAGADAAALGSAALQARAALQNPAAPRASVEQTAQETAKVLSAWQAGKPTPAPTASPKPEEPGKPAGGPQGPGAEAPQASQQPPAKPATAAPQSGGKNTASGEEEKGAGQKTPPASESAVPSPTLQPAASSPQAQPEPSARPAQASGSGTALVWAALAALVLAGAAAAWCLYRRKKEDRQN